MTKPIFQKRVSDSPRAPKDGRSCQPDLETVHEETVHGELEAQ